jgi:two-component system response regulator HydG
MLGASAAMRRVLTVVRRVAPSEASVVVRGETGTGKELVARAIHRRSTRAEGPFVAVNCASMQASLLESELFGHARGAFTDAREDKRGLFLSASGGTLFLDEIGELPFEVQPKLLRALQERTVRPLGSNKEIPFDARVVSATNRVLEDEVFERRFREDLYYRLNVVQIDVPALRERVADVPILAQHFLDRFAKQQGRQPCTLAAEAIDALVAYPWPGNVREVENAMERAVALCGTSEIRATDLPAKIREHRPSTFDLAADHEQDIVSLELVQRRYLTRVLSVLSGNKTRTAQALGIDRRTLYRKLAEAARETKPLAASGATLGREPPR